MVFRVLILAIFIGVPVVNTAAPPAETLKIDLNFYSVRRDVRRCASPMCGGYFIKLVNRSQTRCANSRFMKECYVAEIQWTGQQPETGALVRGLLSQRDFAPQRKFGVLRAREVWLPASDKQASGTFYRVRDRGIRCIAAPCPTHLEAQLNSTVSRNVAGVDLSGAAAPENVVSEANQAMTDPDGVIVSGVHERVTGPAGGSQRLMATQFYLRAQPGGTSSGNDNQNKPCFKTGCSGQVCADEEVVTTCEYRTEYECYKTAKCERQANGKCGFTDTPELRRCLRRN